MLRHDQVHTPAETVASCSKYKNSTFVCSQNTKQVTSKPSSYNISDKCTDLHTFHPTVIKRPPSIRGHLSLHFNQNPTISHNNKLHQKQEQFYNVINRNKTLVRTNASAILLCDTAAPTNKLFSALLAQRVQISGPPTASSRRLEILKLIDHSESTH